MVDMIIADHGRQAIARMAAAYRDGSSDAEALQAGTGETAQALYAAYFRDFDASEPQPVEPAPILPSNVRRPGTAGSPGASPGTGPDGAPAAGAGAWQWLVVLGAMAVLIGLVLALAWAGRRGPGKSVQ